MSLMKIAQADMKKFDKIQKALNDLKAMIENEELPMPLDEKSAADLTSKIESLNELVINSKYGLEAHMDDLQNEGID